MEPYFIVVWKSPEINVIQLVEGSEKNTIVITTYKDPGYMLISSTLYYATRCVHVRSFLTEHREWFENQLQDGWRLFEMILQYDPLFQSEIEAEISSQIGDNDLDWWGLDDDECAFCGDTIASSGRCYGCMFDWNLD